MHSESDDDDDDDDDDELVRERWDDSDKYTVDSGRHIGLLPVETYSL